MDTDLDEDEDMRELEALLYSSIHHGCNNENTLHDTSCPNELDTFSSPDTQTLSLYTVSVTEPSSALLLRGVTNLQALDSFDFFAALSSNISPPLAPQNVSKSKSSVSPRKRKGRKDGPPNLYNTTETECFAEEVIYSSHQSPIISVLSSSPSLSDSLLPLDNASSGLLKQKTSILPLDEKQTPAEKVGRQHSGCGTQQNPYYVSSDCESIGGSSKQNTIKSLCSPSKTEQAKPHHDGGSVSQDGVICPKEVLKSEQIPQTTSAALPKQQSQAKGVAIKVKEQASTLSFSVPVTTSSKPKHRGQIWVDKSRSSLQVDVDKAKSSSHSETKSSLTLKSSAHSNSFISLAEVTDSITLNSDSLGKSLRRLMGTSACKVKNLKSSQQEVGKKRLKPVKSERVLIESDSSKSFSSDDDSDSESSLDSSLQADRFKRGEKKTEPFIDIKVDDSESDSGSNSRKDSSSMDDSGSSGHELDLNWNVNASDEHIIRTVAKDAFRKVDSTKWRVNEMDVNREVNVRIVSRYYPKTNVRCHNCNETGHLSKVCPQPRKKPSCSLCGLYGHSIHHCPNRLCYKCEETGHTSLDCTSPRRNPNSICLRCQMPGHKISQCTDLWRQYHMTVSLDNLIIMEKKMNSTVYCCNCGHKGHFGFACKRSRMERHVLPVYPFVAEYDRDFETKCSRQDTASGNLKSKQQQRLKSNPKGSSEKLHEQRKDEAHDQSYTKDGDYRHISKKQKHCKDNSDEQSYTQDSKYRHISIKQGQWKDNLSNQSYTQSSQYKPDINIYQCKKQEMWKDNLSNQSYTQSSQYKPDINIYQYKKEEMWKDNLQDQSYSQNSKYRHISQQQGQCEDNPHYQSYTQNSEYRHIFQNCRRQEDYSQCQFSTKDIQNRSTSLNPGQWEDNSHGPSYPKNIAYRHTPQKQGHWKDNSHDQLSTQNDEYRHTPQKQEHWEDNSKDHQLYTHSSEYRHVSRQQEHWEGNSQDHHSYTHSSEYRHVSRSMRSLREQEVLSHTSLNSNQRLNGGKSAREKGEDRNNRQQDINSAKRKSGIQEHTLLSHVPDSYTRGFESSEFRERRETRKEKKRQFETKDGLSNVSQVQRRKRKKPQSSEKFQRQRKEKSALHHLQNFSPEDISSGWMLTDIPAHRKLNKKCAVWKPSIIVQASVSPKRTIHHLASMKSETQQRCFTSVPGLQASKRQHEQYDRGEELYTKVSKREPQTHRKKRNRRKNSGPALLNSDIRVQQGQTSRKHKHTFNSAQTLIAQGNKPFHDPKVSKERQIIQSANGFRIAISNINLNKIYQNRQHDMN